MDKREVEALKEMFKEEDLGLADYVIFTRWAIIHLIMDTKGDHVVITPRKIVKRVFGKEHVRPHVYSMIGHALRRLYERGEIELWRGGLYRKYMVRKGSPLWRRAKRMRR